MKHFKKSILVFAIFMFVNTAFGQSETKDSEGITKEAKDFLAKAKEQLQLTSDQETKFIEASTAFMKEARLIRESDIERKQKFKKIKDLQENLNSKVKAFLNKEQYEKYLVLIEERKAKMKRN